MVEGWCWHSKCNSFLAGLFSRRLFGQPCKGCNQGIDPTEMVRQTDRGTFHLRCFICTACRKQLSTGEECYNIGDCEFNCKDDYVISKQHAKASSALLQPFTTGKLLTLLAAIAPNFVFLQLLFIILSITIIMSDIITVFFSYYISMSLPKETSSLLNRINAK